MTLLAMCRERRRRGRCDMEKTTSEKIWDNHLVRHERREAGPALHRPAPRARGDVAAGVRRAAARGAQGAAPGTHARDGRPQRADARPRQPWPDPLSSQQVETSARTARSSASRCSACHDRRQGIVHIIGPGAGADAAGDDDRLRRQPHVDARRVRRARVRHRHVRGRARAGDADAGAGHAEDDVGRGQRRAARRRDGEGRDPRDHPQDRRRLAASATSSSTAATSSAPCRWKAG